MGLSPLIAPSRVGLPLAPAGGSLFGAILKVVTGSDPAAGVEISETVPAGKVWDLLAVSFTFTASATVATRALTLILDDGAAILAQLFAGTNITASQAYRVTFVKGPGATQISPTAFSIAALLPDFLLGPGFRVRTLATNIQVDDNYGASTLYVVEHSV